MKVEFFLSTVGLLALLTKWSVLLETCKSTKNERKCCLNCHCTQQQKKVTIVTIKSDIVLVFLLVLENIRGLNEQ